MRLSEEHTPVEDPTREPVPPMPEDDDPEDEPEQGKLDLNFTLST